MKKQWLAVILTSVCGVCSADDDADRVALQALGERWIAAYEAGDVDTIAKLFTEDAWVMARGRPKMMGRDAIRSSLGGLSGGRKIGIRIDTEELVVLGDWAWSVGAFTVTYGSPEDAEPPTASSGRAMLIYRRDEDGEWRIHRDMDTPAPDVGP